MIGTLTSNSNSGRALRSFYGVTTKAGVATVTLGYVAPTYLMKVLETFKCLADGDFGVNSKANDVWHRVEVETRERPGVKQMGYVAEKHNRETLCIFTPINIPDPDPDPTPLFPERFTLMDPSGAKAEYAFVRVIEE